MPSSSTSSSPGKRKAAREVERLSELLRRYQHEYYVDSHPSVSDQQYDRLFDELLRLEEAFPELRRPDSPTQRVGSDLTQELPEVSHTIPVLSLDKAYTVEELEAWVQKICRNAGRELAFVAEEKIDGASIVLYYEGGALTRAVARGNGLVGNDVTANVRTIGAVPLRLSRPETLAVRGEIFLPLSLFEEINRSQETPYANPRNLASGTLRRVKSAEVAAVPLDILVYEGHFPTPKPSHARILDELAEQRVLPPATDCSRSMDLSGRGLRVRRHRRSRATASARAATGRRPDWRRSPPRSGGRSRSAARARTARARRAPGSRGRPRSGAGAARGGQFAWRGGDRCPRTGQLGGQPFPDHEPAAAGGAVG